MLEDVDENWCSNLKSRADNNFFTPFLGFKVKFDPAENSYFTGLFYWHV